MCTKVFLGGKEWELHYVRVWKICNRIAFIMVCGHVHILINLLLWLHREATTKVYYKWVRVRWKICKNHLLMMVQVHFNCDLIILDTSSTWPEMARQADAKEGWECWSHIYLQRNCRQVFLLITWWMMVALTRMMVPQKRWRKEKEASHACSTQPSCSVCSFVHPIHSWYIL